MRTPEIQLNKFYTFSDLHSPMQKVPGPSSLEQIQTWPLAWQQSLFRKKFIAVWLLIIPLLAAFPVFFQHIEKREGIVLNDWLLNRISVHNVSLPVFIFIWGTTLLAIIRCVKKPQILMLLLWSYLLVSLFRILAIWLVPLDPPPHLIPLVDPLTNFFYGKQYVTKDLFFSGHTSSVFIVFLGLEKRWDKVLSLAFTICIAALLLVQHVHYTIDIIAAPFAAWLAHVLAGMIVRAGHR